MILKNVYSGVPNPAEITNTASLKNAIAIYLKAPNIPNGDEIEIDFTLQSELNIFENRLIPPSFGNFVLDTVLIFRIPLEYQFIDNEIYGSFTSTLSEFIEIWGIFPEVSLSELSENIETIKELQETQFALDIAQALNSIAQDIALGVLSAALTPITLGASAPAIPVLGQSVTALTTALTTAQLLLP